MATTKAFGMIQGRRSRAYLGQLQSQQLSKQITRECPVCGQALKNHPNGKPRSCCSPECSATNGHESSEPFALSPDYDASLSEIAEVLGLSRERVRQIEGSALAKMGARLLMIDRNDPEDPETGLTPFEAIELKALRERQRRNVEAMMVFGDEGFRTALRVGAIEEIPW